MSSTPRLVQPPSTGARLLLASLVAVVAAVAPTPVLASGTTTKPAIEWRDLADALSEARAKSKPAVILLATDGEASFVDQALSGPFAHTSLLRKAKSGAVVFARANATSDLGRRLAAGLPASVVVTDLEGVPLERFEALPRRHQLLDAIKKAEKLCKHKAKLLKQLDKVLDKAEKAMTRQQWRQACLSYSWVISLEDQLADPRIRKARDSIDVLTKKAEEQLREADEFIGRGEYAQAQKRLVAIRNAFPTPRAEEAVIARQVKIDRELNRYQNR